MEIYELANFIAMGAAWGMFWLAGPSLVLKSLSNPELLQKLTLVFIITAGMSAFAFFKGFYAEYAAADAGTKEAIEQQFKGKNGLMFIIKMAVIASPVLFLWKQIKSFKVLVAIVAACYVSIPYHERIIIYLSK